MATKIETPPAKAWAQVTDQALNVPANGSPQMKRAYKLPTSSCREILNGLPRGTSFDAAEAWISRQAGALDAGLSGARFVPANGDSWILESYYLDQREAGEYADLKCVFGYTDLSVDAIASADTWSENVGVTETVTWQSYSVSPYIYCDEVAHQDSQLSATGTVPEPSGGHAMRRHIEMCFTQNAQNSDSNASLWRNANRTYQLTQSEYQIMKKVAAGVNPVFHKPVVQRTFVYRTKSQNGVPAGGNDVDRISAPGVSVAGWTGSFVFTGRQWTKSQETYYTQSNPQGVTIYTMQYTDTWEGALEPDADFYGPNAWVFHQGPDRV